MGMPDLNGLSIEEATAIIFAQYEQIVALTARVKELEDRLGKDSHNSSKPPSSDGLGKKPSPQSQRGKSGRRSGGQHGHPGRTLSFSESPNEVIVHTPSACQGCGAGLEAAPSTEIRRRQVFDIPPTSLVVTEHRAETRCCPECGLTNRAIFPTGVDSPVQYGSRIQAFIAYLTHYQLLPFERVSSMLSHTVGISVSQGTIANITRRASNILKDVESGIKTALTSAGVLHCDETGVRIGGKLNWLHVAGTPSLTFYASHQNRGRAALDHIGILSAFTGTAIHDGWSAYRVYPCGHALCNSHHLRELTAVEEQYGQPWAKDMKDLLLEIKQSVELAKQADALQLHLFVKCGFEARYRANLKRAYDANPPPTPTGRRGRIKQGSARSLVLRLDEYRSSVLAFMYNFTVPFDNNLAERDIRMMKTKQKVSGCFRSNNGAEAFCRIRGYISSMRKQGYNVMTVLQSVFENKTIAPAT
jgi:transposase